MSAALKRCCRLASTWRKSGEAAKSMALLHRVAATNAHAAGRWMSSASGRTRKSQSAGWLLASLAADPQLAPAVVAQQGLPPLGTPNAQQEQEPVDHHAHQARQQVQGSREQQVASATRRGHDGDAHSAACAAAAPPAAPRRISGALSESGCAAHPAEHAPDERRAPRARRRRRGRRADARVVQGVGSAGGTRRRAPAPGCAR